MTTATSSLIGDATESRFRFSGDEHGSYSRIRHATLVDTAELDQLRAIAEGIGGAHSYFGGATPNLADGLPGAYSWPEGGSTLVVERDGELIAAARYLRIGHSGEATIAVAIGDVANRREIGSALVDALARAAHDVGVEHFVADLLTTNAAMLAVFVRSGFPTEIGVGDGVMHMSFSVDPASRDAGRSIVRAVPIWESVVGSCLADLISGASVRAGRR